MKYYKVVTEDLKSLGLRNNPTIFQYAVGLWTQEPSPTMGQGGWGGTGGIWVANGLSNAKNLKKYMNKKGINVKIYEIEVGGVLFSNTYRSKVSSVKLIKEIE